MGGFFNCGFFGTGLDQFFFVDEFVKLPVIDFDHNVNPFF